MSGPGKESRNPVQCACLGKALQGFFSGPSTAFGAAVLAGFHGSFSSGMHPVNMNYFGT